MTPEQYTEFRDLLDGHCEAQNNLAFALGCSDEQLIKDRTIQVGETRTQLEDFINQLTDKS